VRLGWGFVELKGYCSCLGVGWAIFSLIKSEAKKPSKRARRDAELGVAEGVLRLRVKDKHAAVLKAQGKEVNFVWNYKQDLGSCAGAGALSWIPFKAAAISYKNGQLRLAVRLMC